MNKDFVTNTTAAVQLVDRRREHGGDHRDRRSPAWENHRTTCQDSNQTDLMINRFRNDCTTYFNSFGFGLNFF